jgi:hypothetical protein
MLIPQPFSSSVAVPTDVERPLPAVREIGQATCFPRALAEATISSHGWAWPAIREMPSCNPIDVRRENRNASWMRSSCQRPPSPLSRFFSVVHRVWRGVVGMPAKLVLIARELPPSLQHLAHDIILFEPIPGVHTVLLLPALMDRESGGDAVVISDIDMLPMNRPYYVDTIADLPNDRFVVFRSNVLMRDVRQVAMCYNAAIPATWANMMGGIASMQDVRIRLAQWAEAHCKYDGRHGGAEWDADQRILFNTLAQLQNAEGRQGLVLLDDNAMGYRRLDRFEIMQNGGLLLTEIDDVRQRRYSDYHMLRPLSKFRTINHEIVELLFANQVSVEKD